MERKILCYDCQVPMYHGSSFAPRKYPNMRRGWHYECPRCGNHVVLLEGDEDE
jgi:predicted SprT family Zn-dependent metalloprotease